MGRSQSQRRRLIPPQDSWAPLGARPKAAAGASSGVPPRGRDETGELEPDLGLELDLRDEEEIPITGDEPDSLWARLAKEDSDAGVTTAPRVKPPSIPADLTVADMLAPEPPPPPPPKARRRRDTAGDQTRIHEPRDYQAKVHEPRDDQTKVHEAPEHEVPQPPPPPKKRATRKTRPAANRGSRPAGSRPRPKPASKGPPPAPQTAKKKTRSASKSTSSKSGGWAVGLLICTSSESHVSFLRSLLASVGQGRYHVRVAVSRDEAEQILDCPIEQRRRIDAVVIDIGLGSGRDVPSPTEITEWAPDLPVLAFTDFYDERTWRSAIRAGSEDVVARAGLTPSRLSQALATAIERHSAHKAPVIQVKADPKASRYAALVDRSPLALLVLDDSEVVLFANEATRDLFGRDPGKLVGRRFKTRSDTSDLGEAAIHRPDGSSRIVQAETREIDWDDEPATLVTLHDITRHKKTEQDTRKLVDSIMADNARLVVLCDREPDTKLLNEQGLARVLRSEAARARRDGSPLFAMMVACRELGRVRESLGPAAADEVVAELVARVADRLRPSDHLARVGDAILALLPGTREAEARCVAGRLETTLTEDSIPCAHILLRATVDVGIDEVPHEEIAVERLLARVAASVQRTRAADLFAHIGTPKETTLAVQSTSKTVDDVLEAAGCGFGLRAVRHPLIRLNSEAVVGYELLVRGPPGQLESPLRFFEACRQRDLLRSADLQSLRTCLSAASGLPVGMRYHVNLFPQTLALTPTDELLTALTPRLTQGAVCLEISQQQVVGDPGELLVALDGLRRSGVLFALDDVCFGRASLESLAVLSPDVVKLDRRLVTGAAADRGRRQVLRRTLAVARALGAEVVAEGVETDDDLDLIRELGIETGQGYLWGLPED